MSYLDIFRELPWWAWILNIVLYPIYQILGTLKHEGAHALGAKIQGLRILEFRYLPSRIDGRWYWGYVRFDGMPNTTTRLMPYYVDAIVFIIGVSLFWTNEEWWAQHAQLFLPSFILTIILPIVDVIYNLGKWWIGDRGDFAEAFKDI